MKERKAVEYLWNGGRDIDKCCETSSTVDDDEQQHLALWIVKRDPGNVTTYMADMQQHSIQPIFAELFIGLVRASYGQTPLSRDFLCIGSGVVLEMDMPSTVTAILDKTGTNCYGLITVCR